MTHETHVGSAKLTFYFGKTKVITEFLYVFLYFSPKHVDRPVMADVNSKRMMFFDLDLTK